MNGPHALPTAFPAVVAVALAGCTAIPVEDAAARAANEAAIADGLPAGAEIVVVENGVARGAETLSEVFAAPPDSDSRFVFRVGEDGERSFTLAFLPRSGIVAGDGFLAAIGAELRTGAGRSLTLVRGTRSLPVADDRTIELRLRPPGAATGTGESVRVTVDPDARGALLLPRPLALRLGAPGCAIPGTAYVDVALGRPFTAQRARLHAEIPALGVASTVEVLYAAPPPGVRP